MLQVVVCLLFLSFSQMSLKFTRRASEAKIVQPTILMCLLFLRSEKEDHLKTGWI